MFQIFYLRLRYRTSLQDLLCQSKVLWFRIMIRCLFSDNPICFGIVSVLCQRYAICSMKHQYNQQDNTSMLWFALISIKSSDQIECQQLPTNSFHPDSDLRSASCLKLSFCSSFSTNNKFDAQHRNNLITIQLPSIEMNCR